MTRREITQAIIVFAVVLFVVVAWGIDQARERQSRCIAAEASREELAALNEIADQLGIPHEFTVPEVPAECND